MQKKIGAYQANTEIMKSQESIQITGSLEKGSLVIVEGYGARDGRIRVRSYCGALIADPHYGPIYVYIYMHIHT